MPTCFMNNAPALWFVRINDAHNGFSASVSFCSRYEGAVLDRVGVVRFVSLVAKGRLFLNVSQLSSTKRLDYKAKS